MIKLLQRITFAALLALGLAGFANAQSAAQWNYAFDGTNPNVAQATYPGTVRIKPLISAPCLTTDTNGVLTSGGCSGGTPGGAAGGDLSGTYPNPTVAKVNGVAYQASPVANRVPVSDGAGSAPYSQVPNAALANPSTTVNGQTCTLGASCTVTAAASLTVGTTTVTSGTTTRILFDNAGVLGEYLLTGTGNTVAMSAGPAFTGTPTAPTATCLNNSTQLATTAYMDSCSNIVLGTPQATTSGTSKDFTGIPSWVHQVTINFSGVSTSGTSVLQVQIGDSGGIETTGYSGGATQGGGSGATCSGTGFCLSQSSAGTLNISGTMILTLENNSSATWIASGDGSWTGSGFNGLTWGGAKSLSPGPLDRIRLTTQGGTDTFDAGEMNVTWQ